MGAYALLVRHGDAADVQPRAGANPSRRRCCGAKTEGSPESSVREDQRGRSPENGLRSHVMDDVDTLRRDVSGPLKFAPWSLVFHYTYVVFVREAPAEISAQAEQRRA